MDDFALGLKVSYRIAEIEYPWISKIWKHLEHIAFQNLDTQQVEVFYDFDRYSVLRWFPILATPANGTWDLVERPFAFIQGRFAVLDLNVKLGNQLVHIPGTIEDQLRNVNMLSAEYIAVSSILGWTGKHDLKLFVMNS